MSPHHLFAACLPGLEPLLAAELRALGAEPKQLAGGCSFTGDTALLKLAHLWLGTASHVLLRCADFRCRSLGELERKAALLPWQQWLLPGTPRQLRATSSRSLIYHTGAIEERVGRAITTALGPAGEGDGAALAVRFRDDFCTISLDTSITPLHRRGYKLESAKAPLREDLAHALLLASGWQPGAPLLDPFCGSGTIPIEAAGLCQGLAPGRLRPPPLHHTAMFDEAVWQQVQARALRAAVPTPIAASDRDAGAIAAATANAERAGVATAIGITCCALAAQPWLSSPATTPAHGVAVTNPPFGHRVGKGRDLTPLYQTLGHRLQQLDGWRLAILATDHRLARRTGLELHAAFHTRHGGLGISALVGDARPAAAAPG